MTSAVQTRGRHTLPPDAVPWVIALVPDVVAQVPRLEPILTVVAARDHDERLP